MVISCSRGSLHPINLFKAYSTSIFLVHAAFFQTPLLLSPPSVFFLSIIIRFPSEQVVLLFSIMDSQGASRRASACSIEGFDDLDLCGLEEEQVGDFVT